MSEDLNGAGEVQWRGDGHPLINHEITTATGRAAVIKGVRQAPGGTGLQFLLVFSDQDYIVMDENTLRMAIHTRPVGPAHASAVDPSRGQDGAASTAMHPPNAGDLLARVKPEPPSLPEATPQVASSREDSVMSPAVEDQAPMKSEAPPPRPRGVKRPRPSTTPPVPMTPELLTTLQALLQRLAAPPFAKNFCRPVAEINAEAMERYRALIKRPIDLGTVYVKLRQSAYPDLARFEKDVERVFNNCERFNSTAPANHVIVAHAKHLRDLFRGLFSEMVPYADNEERVRRREERLAACQDVVMTDLDMHLLRQRIETTAGSMVVGAEGGPGQADLATLEAILSPSGGRTVRAVYECLGALGHGGLRAGALEALHLVSVLVYEKTYRGAVYSSIWATPHRLVWATQKKGVQWPCMVLMEGDVPEAVSRINRQRMPLESIRSLKRTNKIAGAFVVENFGTHDFHWAPPETLRPYDGSGVDPNEKHVRKEGFERGCTEIRYAYSAMKQEPGYTPEEADAPDRLQSMDLSSVEAEVQRQREGHVGAEEGEDEEEDEEEAAVALLRNDDEKRRSLEARPRAPKKPKDVEEGPSGVGGSAKKRRVSAGGRKIKKQNAIDKIRQFVASIGLQDKVLRELNVAARPKIKRRLVIASPTPFMPGEALSARDLLDAPMLFGGRPPIPIDPYDTDSDLDDFVDEDIDWTNAAQRKNAMRRREQALQREIVMLQEVRRKQRAFGERALGPVVRDMFPPLPAATPGLHETHSGYLGPTTAQPKKRGRPPREAAAEGDREAAGYHYEPSQFTGVSRSGTRFVARITFGGRKQNLGSFETEREAAMAYDQAAREYYGARAKVNFDEHGNRTNLKQGKRAGPTSPAPPRPTYESMQGGGRPSGGYGGNMGHQSGSGASSDGEGAYGGQYQQAQLSETESEEEEEPRGYSTEALRARERLDEDDDDDDTDVTEDEDDQRAYYGGGNVFDAYRMAVQGRQQQQHG